jgi:hypothetical protein
MKITWLLRTALIGLPLLSLAGCGQSRTETRSDDSVALMAMGPPTSDVPVSEPKTAPPAMIPDEVLRDPAQRFALMERVRTEVVHKTQRVSDERWYNELRPALGRQLRDAGMAAADVKFLLLEIDQGRPQR